MKGRVVVTVIPAALLWVSATWPGDAVLSSAIPSADGSGKANIYYCDALIGSVIQGWSNKAADRFPLLSKESPPPNTMQALSMHPTDRIVLIIESDQKTLSMSSRRDFETGGNGVAAPSPYDILELDDNYIVGFAAGAAGVNSSSLITIDRKQGLGTWSTTLTRDVISGVPRVDSMVLSCGSRRP
ncbi:MAG: hypothetical protein HYX63_08870 [Gammaproteobacteria bacterium]|nr:hypothetical protein [Gammaproteobacteria bacterium]